MLCLAAHCPPSFDLWPLTSSMSASDSYSMILWYSRLAFVLYVADRSRLRVISCQFEIILFVSYVRLGDRLSLVTFFGFYPSEPSQYLAF